MPTMLKKDGFIFSYDTGQTYSLLQDYWFKHETPKDIEYTDELKSEMEYLLRGWYKSKAYINSNPKVNDKETGKVCGSVELCDPTHAAPGH